MDNNVKQEPFEMNWTAETEKKTIADRVEDFFDDYGTTLIIAGTYICYGALVLITVSYLKKALKNGLTINVITPFPVKTK